MSKSPRFPATLVLMTSLVATSGIALWPAASAGGAEPQGFQFAVIGDLGYDANEEPLLANVLEDLNGAKLDLVFHLGDLSSPAFACTDEHQSKRLAQFQASVHPFIYTPGDNDWTDCHPARAIQAKLIRLNALRRSGSSFSERKRLWAGGLSPSGGRVATRPTASSGRTCASPSGT